MNQRFLLFRKKHQNDNCSARNAAYYPVAYYSLLQLVLAFSALVTFCHDITPFGRSHSIGHGEPCPYDDILSRKERIVKQPSGVRYDEIQQVAASFVLVKLKHQLVPCLAVDAQPCVAAMPQIPVPYAPYAEAVLSDRVHSARHE